MIVSFSNVGKIRPKMMLHQVDKQRNNITSIFDKKVYLLLTGQVVYNLTLLRFLMQFSFKGILSKLVDLNGSSQSCNELLNFLIMCLSLIISSSLLKWNGISRSIPGSNLISFNVSISFDNEIECMCTRFVILFCERFQSLGKTEMKRKNILTYVKYTLIWNYIECKVKHFKKESKFININSEIIVCQQYIEIGCESYRVPEFM